MLLTENLFLNLIKAHKNFSCVVTMTIFEPQSRSKLIPYVILSLLLFLKEAK